MKLIKTNQELIVGRKYLCRTKPIKAQNGSFSVPYVEIHQIFEEDGRRYVGKNRFWAYDKYDRIISYKGNVRIKKEADDVGVPESEISVIDSDYEVNSQALERWDIIGPIPEIKKEILDCLFDYPDFLECFSRVISFHPDGDIAVKLEPTDLDDAFVLIQGKESVQEYFNPAPAVTEEEICCEELHYPKDGFDVILTEDKYNSDCSIRFPKGMKLKLIKRVEYGAGMFQAASMQSILLDPKSGNYTLSVMDGFKIIR